MIRLILCVVGISCVFSAPQYRDLIPNGYQVFNPCGANFWEAVGHYNDVHHTIDKNPFGKVKPKKTDMLTLHMKYSQISRKTLFYEKYHDA